MLRSAGGSCFAFGLDGDITEKTASLPV